MKPPAAAQLRRLPFRGRQQFIVVHVSDRPRLRPAGDDGQVGDQLTETHFRAEALQRGEFPQEFGLLSGSGHVTVSPICRCLYNSSMTTQITDQQRAAIAAVGDRPIDVVDPQTNRRYVLISREQYERLKPLFEDDPLSEPEQRDLLRRVGERAGWDDPEMDAYDRYDEHRSQSP